MIIHNAISLRGISSCNKGLAVDDRPLLPISHGQKETGSNTPVNDPQDTVIMNMKGRIFPLETNGLNCVAAPKAVSAFAAKKDVPSDLVNM